MRKILIGIMAATTIFLKSSLVTSASVRTINFSGYDWNVKNSYFGPGPNWWTALASDVYTDASGALHLSVINHNGTWYSSEVYLPSSLGYGSYRFVTTSNVDSLDPNLVLGLFMYQNDTHEIDTEYSSWGIAGGSNLGYSIQPAGTKGNNYQFTTSFNSNLPVTNEIDWQPNKIIFRTSQNGVLLKEWTYTGTNNFAPGKEFADINFWMMKGLAPTNGQNIEAVIRDFQFIPYSAPSIPIATVSIPTIQAQTSTTQTSTKKRTRKITKVIFRKLKKYRKSR